MPIFTATHIGAAARQFLQNGEVHSVFHKAVNLMGGQTLITLISADAHEYAVTIPDLPDFSARLGAEQKFTRAGGALSFPAADIAVDFSRAEIWKQPRVTCAATAETMQKRVSIIRQTLAEYKCGDTSGVMARLYELADAWPADHQNWLERLKPLVGLGPGLTPLGDDFISGYLAASFYLRPDVSAEESLAAAGELSGGSTTIFSRRQMLLAGQGLCLGSIAAAIASLAAADFDVRAIGPVLKIGATSGCGWLLGIACACKALPYSA